MLPDQVFNTFAVVQALKCNATINGGLLDQNWVTLQLRIEFERACALFRFLRVNYEHQNLNHLHAFFHRIFSLDYFVCRMTYRYFKDISGKNRSCLRRIYECDDSSCKPMVLYVSDIFYKCTNSDEALWLEFCDGWYFGEFKVDHHISSLVRNNEIFIGQKLILFHSEVGVSFLIFSMLDLRMESILSPCSAT